MYKDDKLTRSAKVTGISVKLFEDKFSLERLVRLLSSAGTSVNWFPLMYKDDKLTRSPKVTGISVKLFEDKLKFDKLVRLLSSAGTSVN